MFGFQHRINAHTIAAPAEIAQNASIIISMVPTGKHVREVYLGDNSVMTALNSLSQEERAATLCLDQSTIEQSVSKDVALAMRAVGADMLDAPISGGMTYRGELSPQMPHIQILTCLQGLSALRMAR